MRITVPLLLIEVGASESHELLNSSWMGPSGSGDPHGVQGTRCGGLGLGKKSLHTSRSVFHTKIALRGATFGRSICCRRARVRAGSKSHATPIGARTTAIHLVNALGGKKVRSRRARDIKLPLAPLSSSHLMPPVPMLPSQVKHLAYYSGAFALTLRRGIEGTLTATERRFFPARRCFFAALTPSVPTAKLSFALCAAFRTAGGRGDAAGLQGMRR